MASGLGRTPFGDKDYEQTLNKWFDELFDDQQKESSDVEDQNDETIQENEIIEDDSTSTSEQEYVPSDHEEEGSEVEVETADQHLTQSGDNLQSDDVTDMSYKGKNNYTWKSKEPNKALRTLKHNIIIKLPSLKQAANRLGNNPDVCEIWNPLFDNEMLNEVVLRTNEKLEAVRSTHKNSDTTDTFCKCYSCQKPICLEHASKMCKNCVADQEDR